VSPDVAERTGAKDALRQFINLNKGPADTFAYYMVEEFLAEVKI
jgi:hypothetical protein